MKRSFYVLLTILIFSVFLVSCNKISEETTSKKFNLDIVEVTAIKKGNTLELSDNKKGYIVDIAEHALKNNEVQLDKNFSNEDIEKFKENGVVISIKYNSENLNNLYETKILTGDNYGFIIKVSYDEQDEIFNSVFKMSWDDYMIIGKYFDILPQADNPEYNDEEIISKNIDVSVIKNGNILELSDNEKQGIIEIAEKSIEDNTYMLNLALCMEDIKEFEENGLSILVDYPKTEPLPPKGGRFNQRLKPPKVG